MAPAPASANYFGPAGGLGCCAYTDNGALYFNQDSTVVTVYGALNYARSVFNTETDMTTGYDSTPDGSTDIEAFDAYYTTTWGLDWDGSDTGYNLYAYSKCVNFTLTLDCDQYEQRYDLADVLSFTTSQLRSLALHETGHSVGLDHSGITDSMMQTGKKTIIHINAHDKAHINGRW